MPEWWTYSLSDFLMFAPRTYYRLVELANADAWPLHLVALLAGVALAMPAVRRTRLAPALLAVAWAWVAWWWFAQRYATINWAAQYFAIAFALQALLLALFALRQHGLGRTESSSAFRLGTGLAALGVVAYPLVAVLAGRGWGAAEVVGLAADPTAIATLGVLVASSTGARALLLPIPLAWCALGGATLWTMGSPEWWLMPLAALGAIGSMLAARRAAHRTEHQQPDR